MCSHNHLHLLFHQAPSAMFSLNSEFPTYTPVFAKGFQPAQWKRIERTPDRMPSASPDQSPSPFRCIWAAVEMWTVAPLVEHKRYRASPALFNLSECRVELNKQRQQTPMRPSKFRKVQCCSPLSIYFSIFLNDVGLVGKAQVMPSTPYPCAYSRQLDELNVRRSQKAPNDVLIKLRVSKLCQSSRVILQTCYWTDTTGISIWDWGNGFTYSLLAAKVAMNLSFDRNYCNY